MPFVDGPPGYGNRIVVDNAFAAAGVDRTVAVEVADVGTAATYIRNGLGIGFLSWSLFGDIDVSGLVTVRVADCDLRWRLHVATSATRPPSAATRALLSLVEDRSNPGFDSAVRTDNLEKPVPTGRIDATDAESTQKAGEADQH
jgi:DNA-binding transcriptional LysR family regulator